MKRSTSLETIPFPRTFTELWHQVFSRGGASHPLIQFLKYGFVGGLATLVDMVAFFTAAWLIFPALAPNDFLVQLLTHLDVLVPVAELEQSVRANHQLFDNGIAFLISNTFCYVLNAAWVFQPGRHSRIKECLLFFLASGVSSGTGILIADVLVRWLGAQTSWSYIAKMVASVLINYIARKKIVFQG